MGQETTKKPAAETIKKERKSGSRSPNFPIISLEDAISKVRKIDKRNIKVGFDKLAFIKAIGYKGISGASNTVLSAIKKYALIDEKKGSIFLSDIAINILYAPESSEDRPKAIRIAALSPDIFIKIIEYYRNNDSALPTDDILQFDIVKNFNFTLQAAPLFVRIFRETMVFAGIDVNNVLPVQEKDNGSDFDNTQNQNPMEQPINAQPKGTVSTYPIPLDNSRKAILQFNEKEFSKNDIKRIRLWLDFYEAGLPDNNVNDLLLYIDDISDELKTFPEKFGRVFELDDDVNEDIFKDQVIMFKNVRINSIGKNKKTGKMYASTSLMFSNNHEYDCIWAR